MEESSARMPEHHRNQSTMQKTITEVKTKITERKAYAVSTYKITNISSDRLRQTKFRLSQSVFTVGYQLPVPLDALTLHAR